jgi:predicted phosphodiesterase
MRIAIISDTHGNLTAFDAVLEDLESVGPFDEVLVGGDIAYGGPFPRECIERVIERGYRAVKGNTDELIMDASGEGTDAHAKWVVDRLDQKHVDFLFSLPVQQRVDAGSQSLALVHATPWSVWESVFPDHEDEPFSRMLNEADAGAVAYGHIHVQHQRNLPTGVVIAVGAVGMPYDGDQRAMYTVIEASSRSWNVDFRRVAYDVEKAIAEAANCGSPNGEAFARNLTSAVRPH